MTSPATGVPTEPALYPLFPLVPLARDVRRAGAGAVARVEYPDIGWTIDWTDAGPPVAVPQYAVDVALALAEAYHAAGRPADRVVRFSRHDLIRRMGWLGRGNARRPGAKARTRYPSGAQYGRLALALDYLHRTVFERDVASWVPDVLYWQHGTRVRMIQTYAVAARTRSAVHAGDAFDAEFVLSDLYVRQMPTLDDVATLNLDLHFGLTPGLPRLLHRLLQGWRDLDAEQTSRFMARPHELLRRLGSTDRRASISVVQRVLGPAMRELVAAGVLDRSPMRRRVSTDRDGWRRWQVHLDWGESRALSRMQEQLVREACKLTALRRERAVEMVIEDYAAFSRAVDTTMERLRGPSRLHSRAGYFVDAYKRHRRELAAAA